MSRLNEPDQERGAALDVETELNLARFYDVPFRVLYVGRRIHRHEAEHHQQQHQNGGEDSFPEPVIGGEIPAEQDQHDHADDESEGGTHWEELRVKS